MKCKSIKEMHMNRMFHTGILLFFCVGSVVGMKKEKELKRTAKCYDIERILKIAKDAEREADLQPLVKLLPVPRLRRTGRMLPSAVRTLRAEEEKIKLEKDKNDV